MKKLQKSEVCESREQCTRTLFTGEIQQLQQKRKKKKKKET